MRRVSRRRHFAVALAVGVLLRLASPAAALDEGPSGATTGDSGQAIPGLDLTGDAQEETGAARTRVTVDVPAGRNGMTPALALTYSSVVGSTPYGLGWNLVLGKIERSTRLGVPRYDTTDTLVVTLPSATRELVAVTGGYAARIDDQHWFVSAGCAGATNCWTLHDRAGRTYTFGGSDQSRVPEAATVTNSTFSWHLTQIKDLAGNTIDVTYKPSLGYPYPDRVEWGGNGSLGHAYKVVFTFLDRAADGFGARIQYAGRERQDYTQYLKTITVQTSASSTLRSYDLTWTPSANGSTPLLTAVQLKGSLGGALSIDGGPAAPTRFYYEQPDPNRFTAEAGTSLRNADQPSPRGYFREPNCIQHDFVDMNGDGRPDLVNTGNWSSTNKKWKVFLNVGRGDPTGELFADTAIQWDAQEKCIVQTPQVTDPDANAVTDVAVMDMNGDGFPDLIHVESQKIRVNLNNHVNGFDAGIDWTNSRAQGWHLRQFVPRSVDSVGGSTQIDVVDLNGDGRPELIDTTDWNNNGHKWKVWFGNANGWKDGSVLISTPFEFIQYASPADLVCDDQTGCHAPPITRTFSKAGLFDINGDGLPDIIHVVKMPDNSYRWNIWYGKGTSFEATADHWDDVPQTGYIRLWKTIECTPNDRCDAMTQDMVDVNGDGLVDWVNSEAFSASAHQWRVRWNTGRGFSPATTIEAQGHIRRGTYPRVLTSGGDTIDGAMAVDFFDIDGDKLPDSVLVPDVDSNTALIRFQNDNIERKPDLLTKIVTPVGGTTTFTYAFGPHVSLPNTDPSLGIPAGDLPAVRSPLLPFPFWVVARVANDPGLSTDGSVMNRDYQYDGPYYDADRRELVGFARVKRMEVTGFDNSGSPLTSSRTTSYHLSKVLRGRVRQQVIENGTGNALQATFNTWLCEPSLGVYQTCINDESRQFPVLRTVQVTSSSSPTDYPWLATSGKTATTTNAYDMCGNVTSTLVTAPATQSLQTDTSFGTTCAGLGVCNITGACNLPGTRNVGPGLRTDYVYFPNGLVQYEKRIGPPDLTIESHYDAYGNLDWRKNARGYTTHFAYDTPQLHVTTVTNPLSQVTTTAYHPLWGLPTTIQDANTTLVSTRDYDEFGRLSLIAEPGQTTTAPTVKYKYAIGLEGYRIDTMRLEPSRSADGGYLTTSKFYDGLGRQLQTQAVTEVDGNERVVITEAVRYDFAGRTATQYAPKVVATAVGTRSRFTVSDPATYTSYDEFNRPLFRIAPDLASTAFSRTTAWTERTCDPLHMAQPAGGKCEVVTRDGLAREVKHEVFLGASTTAYSTLETYYDAKGLLYRTRQNLTDATATVTTFDAYGRKATFFDPDSGTWGYGFDENDNLKFENDPKTGQHVDYTYDPIDRIATRVQRTGDVAASGTVNHTATYVYDGVGVGNGKGRLQKLIDSQSGTFEIVSYDARGNPLERKRTIILDGVPTPTHDSTLGYDPIGRLSSMTLPYNEADKSEFLVYQYSAQGYPITVLSDHGAYVRNVKHDLFGRISWIQYGNFVEDTFTFGIAADRFRLQEIKSQRAGAPQPDRDLQYLDYDENGNVRLIHDAQRPGIFTASQGMVAEYDDQSRLTKSYQCGGTPYVSDFGYTPAGNITQKDGLNYTPGSPPHQIASVGGLSMSYDVNGRISTLPDGRTLTYDFEGRVMEVKDGPGMSAGSLARYDYDPSGMRVVRKEGSQAPTYFFDDFDVDTQTNKVLRHIRLGNRIIASSPMDGGLSLVASADRAPLIYLARLSIGGGLFGIAIGLAALGGGRRRGKRLVSVTTTTLFLWSTLPIPDAHAACPAPTTGSPPAGTIFYHLDHLGTVQAVSDAAGATFAYTIFRPYGTRRGPYTDTGGAADDSAIAFGFTGQRVADDSGLIYFAARYYDPGLGMFVAEDPARQFFNPYPYGPWNPLTGTDPTGADYEDEENQVSTEDDPPDMSVIPAFDPTLSATSISTVEAKQSEKSDDTPEYLQETDAAPTRAVQPCEFDRRTEQRLSELHPEVEYRAREQLHELHEQGIDARVGQGYRTYEEQDRLFAQGRPGGPPGKIVTNAEGGESIHNFRAAYDVNIYDEHHNYIENGGDWRYQRAGEIGEHVGLEWGGRWTMQNDGINPDLDHFQLRNGIPTATMRERWEQGVDIYTGE